MLVTLKDKEEAAKLKDEYNSRLAGVEQKLKTIHTNLQGVAGYGRK